MGITFKSKPFEVPVVIAAGRDFVLVASGSDLYDPQNVQSQFLSYMSSLGQLTSSVLRAWEQLKQRKVWFDLNSGMTPHLLLGREMPPVKGDAVRLEQSNGSSNFLFFFCGQHKSHETRPLLLRNKSPTLFLRY